MQNILILPIAAATCVATLIGGWVGISLRDRLHQVLARDVGEWFIANGGLRRANGESLRSKVLSRGRSLDPQAMFVDFYGRPPDVAPLVAYRGL